MTTQAAPRVLVVDDDLTVSDVVSRYLRREGYDVVSCADGHEALRLAADESPDLVVLDIMLPGMDGLAVCRALRETSPVPVILLTALGAETDRIVGLEVGADDYVTKPFSPRELVLRVGSVLRRAQHQPAGAPAMLGRDLPTRPLPLPNSPAPAPAQAGVFVDGPLRVDLAAHEVELDGELLMLTVREFDLLAFLIAHPRQVYSREELMREVWGWTFGDHSTVTVHVRRLRQKLELPAGDQSWGPIATVWGVGYRYDPWTPGGSGGAA